MRLKHRLTLTLTLVTAFVLGGSFAIIWVLVRRNEMDDLDRAVRAQAAVVAFLALQRDPLAPAVPDGQTEIPELPIPVRRRAAIYAHGGQLLSTTPTLGAETPSYERHLARFEPLPPEGVLFDLTVRGRNLRGVVLPLGDQGARLLYALPRFSIDDDMNFLAEVFFILFFAATGLTALVGSWLGARLAGDVDGIARVARAVAGGNLAARVSGAASGSAETRSLGIDLDHMIEQLDELVASQRMFVSHAAHELRSPLATLRGELQLALRRPRSADEYRETLDGALLDVEGLIALAEDLLALARHQGNSGQFKLQRLSSTPLRDALNDALRMARGPAECRGVRFVEPELAADLLVRGTRIDVARAIRNLLDNAVKHSPDGGVVQIEARAEQDRALLSVADQGAGVAPQDAPHIFYPFFRGSKEQSGEGRGAGLGLAIVREIAHLVGGTVRLDTSYQQGARFLLELPLSPGP